MSLMDDARRLDCLCNADEGNHGDSCVLVLKSKILAVLEAAEQLEARVNPDDYDDNCMRAWCHCCGSAKHDWVGPLGDAMQIRRHEPQCPWQTLEAALKGEEVE